jgi:hypothetical protein
MRKVSGESVDFSKVEREVFATCQGCGNETSFPYVAKGQAK